MLRNKTRPRECVAEVAAWCVSVSHALFNRRHDSRETDLHVNRVVSEREMREKLKKEKEEVN